MKWTIIEQADGTWAVVDEAGTVIVGGQATREHAVGRLQELAASALGSLPPGGIASGRGARFRMTYMEGERTSDGRVIDPMATRFDRTPPLPIMLNTETSEGHQGARLSGVIDSARRDSVMVICEGNFDAGSEAGVEHERLVREGILTTWSPDIGDAEIKMESLAEPGDGEDDDILGLLLGLGPSLMHLVSGTLLGGCYSDDTELLTERGWLPFADLPPDVRVATRNPKTKAFEWQLPTQFHRYDHHKELIHFRSKKNLDLLVTPDHRMLVRSSKTGEERVMLASELAEAGRSSANFGIPMTTAEWAAPDVVLFRIDGEPEPSEGECACGCGEPTPMRTRWEGGGRGPGSYPKTLQGHGHGRNTEPLILNGDAFAAFMGAWLAEGSLFMPQGRVHITQARDGRGWERYREILTALTGREPSYDGHHFTIKNARLARYLEPLGHAPDKHIPAEVKNLSARQLRLLIDAYLLGDGSATEAKAWTTSPRLAGDLQELAQKLGLWATVNRRVKTADCTMAGGRVISAENALPCYVVTFRNERSRREHVWHFDAERVPYDSEVFCVSVPNTFLYVRRNGRPAWCGNTGVPFPALASAKIELDETIPALAASLVAGGFPYVRPTGTIEIIEESAVTAAGEPCVDCEERREALVHELDEGAALTFLAFESEALHYGSTGGSVSDAAWDGSAGRFTDDQYKFAAAACDGKDSDHPKSDCFLPHHEPGGAINRNGVHAAAQRAGQLSGHPADAVSRAKAHLRSHYTKDLDEKAPDSLMAEGGSVSADASLFGERGPEVTVPPVRLDLDLNVDEALESVARVEAALGRSRLNAGAIVVNEINDSSLETAARVASALAARERALADFRPPASRFADPHLEEPTPATIEGDRFFGHLAQWGVCHTGILDRCVLAPHSRSGYAYFMQGSVTCEGGERIRTGHLTIGCGHADLALSAEPARAHYDGGPGAVCAAHLAVGEDAHGIWFSGTVDPRLDDFQRWELETLAISGDWRVLGGHLELIAALSVPVPGFPILASGAPTEVVLPQPELMFNRGELVAVVAAGTIAPRRVAMGLEMARLRQRVERLEALLESRTEPLLASAAERLRDRLRGQR